MEKKELDRFKIWNDFNLYNHSKVKIGKIDTKIL